MKKFIVLLIFKIFLTSNAFALIEVDITRGNLDPLPIAVSPLHVDIKSEAYDGIKIKELGENISSIVEKNFSPSIIFQMIFWPILTVVASLWLLPKVKGAFIAVQIFLNDKKS